MWRYDGKGSDNDMETKEGCSFIRVHLCGDMMGRFQIMTVKDGWSFVRVHLHRNMKGTISEKSDLKKMGWSLIRVVFH